MSSGRLPSPSCDLLELEHVSKRYGGANAFAVDDVSFRVKAGQTFGLVGESGSGKTTIARLILRLDSVTSGHIRFLGRDLTTLGGYELRRVRQNLQIVFQDPLASLNRRKTVGQIIEFPLLVHGPRQAEARKKLVDQVLDLTGLPRGYVNRYPHELSGGQGQRVGIARAIVLNPRLLVLDEAVSSLDVSIRAQILNLLRKLQQQLGLTYLFISHDLAVVRYMSDHVGVMFRGRIVESGSRQRLFANPRHPYTEELLRVAPGHRSANGGSSEGWDSAGNDCECRYRARCYLGRDLAICRDSDPALTTVDTDHSVACHLRMNSDSVRPAIGIGGGHHG